MIFFLAVWENIEYNHGSHFDGSTFTAPVKGIYTFFVTALQKSFSFGFLSFFMNGNAVSYTKRSNCNKASVQENVNSGPLLLQITLQLEKNDIVNANFAGSFFNLDDPQTTYFEGRLVSVISE